MRGSRYPNKRNALFLLFVIILIPIFYPPLRDLLRVSQHSDYYSHIILIPLISTYLIFLRRKTVFLHPQYSYGAGAAGLALGTGLFLIGRSQATAFLNQNDHLSLMMLSAIVLGVGGFVLLYGMEAFRSAFFPFLFLVFMIPIPTALMDKIIFSLQVGSTQATHLLFKIIGMPFSQEGFVFNLPGISIEVDKQCSGIRSSLALLITGILAGHLFLRANWRKALLAFSVFPIAIFKNAVRIVIVSLLAVYFGEETMEGFLHKSGGFLFYILGLGILGAILWLLRRSDGSKTFSQSESAEGLP